MHDEKLYARARELFDASFGFALHQARGEITTNIGAARIYECGVRAIYWALGGKPTAEEVAAGVIAGLMTHSDETYENFCARMGWSEA